MKLLEISKDLAQRYHDKALDTFTKRIDRISNPKNEKSVRKVKNARSFDTNVPGFEGVPLERPLPHANKVSIAKDTERERIVGGINRAKRRIGETEQINPTDTITLDVPLFIRLMEYAREDAKTDMDLHNIATNAIEMCGEGKTLSMQDYEAIISKGH